METTAFLELIWATGSHDSIAAMYNKAHQVLQIALLGMEQLEPQYDYVGTRLATALMPTITQETIQHFLRTKTEYAVDLRPKPRISWNWSSIQDRYVKWQADLIDLRNLNMGWPYALTIVDTFTKYAFAFPMPSKTGVETARLFDRLFARKPVLGSAQSQFKPGLLLTDQGSEFRSKETNSVCKFHRVFQIFSFAYSPLGMIERFNQTLKRKIRKTIAKGWMASSNFATVLQLLVRDYNSSIHSTTQQRPIVMHFVVEQPHKDRILRAARQRVLAIRQRAQAKALAPLIPLDVGTRVRTLSLKDPRLSRKERNQIRKRMEYKKFGHSYWTKHHFVVGQRDDRDRYKLRGYPDEKFQREELQRVVRP